MKMFVSKSQTSLDFIKIIYEWLKNHLSIKLDKLVQ